MSRFSYFLPLIAQISQMKQAFADFLRRCDQDVAMSVISACLPLTRLAGRQVPQMSQMGGTRQNLPVPIKFSFRPFP